MINYKLISDSVEYYNKFNFQYIETPWIVDRDVVLTTLPQNNNPSLLNNKNFLVGSAEQGFLHLWKHKNIKGIFQSISPCFREDEEDELHQKYFIKNELFCNYNVSNNMIRYFIDCAKNYFNNFLKTKVIQISEYSFDIIDSEFGIKLGSYGMRHNNLGEWVFGTAVAEPRLSYVMSKYK